MRPTHFNSVVLLLSLLSSAIAFTQSRAAPAATPTWSLSSDDKIRWFTATPAGPVVLGTDKAIRGVSPDSGRVLWERGPLKKPDPDAMRILSGSPLVILSLGEQKESDLSGVSLFDPRDGRDVWTAPALGLRTAIGSFVIPGADQLLLVATRFQKGDKRTAVLVEITSGRTIWSSDALGEAFEPVLEHRLGYADVMARHAPLQDSDSTMIFHLGRSRFQKYDLRTGRMLWEAADQPAHKVGIGAFLKAKTERYPFPFQYPPMLLSTDPDRFYAPYMNTVAPFLRSTGQRLWTDVPNLGGALVVQMEEVPAGLLVRTVQPGGGHLQTEIHLLDHNTGGTSWKAGRWEGASNFIMQEGKRVLIAAEGRLRALDLATGTETLFAPLAFKGGDEPNSMRRVESGYCVIGSSNLSIHDPKDGHSLVSYYRPSPGGSGLGWALLGVGAIAAMAGPVDVGSGVTVSGGIDPIAAMGGVTKDYSSSKERDHFVYFVAEIEGDGGIVRVRPETGEVTGEIILGTKSPKYTIDAEGRLIYHADSKTIHGYRF